MSPWQEKQRRRWPVYTGILLVVMGMGVGLLLMLGTVAGGEDAGHTPARPGNTDESTPTDPPTDAERGTPELRVASWGQERNQLAVVVRNDSDQLIDRAQVRITGHDASGRQVVSATGTPDDLCCTILGLAPGEEYGIYAPVRPQLAEISEVNVEYVTRVTRPAEPTEGQLTVADSSLQRGEDGAVVLATLQAQGPVPPYVAVQALLVDASGDVAQVISGRYWCFEAGTERRIRLELFHPVPEGVGLDKVVAHPIPPGVDQGVRGKC